MGLFDSLPKLPLIIVPDGPRQPFPKAAERKRPSRNSFIDNVFRDMVKPKVGSVVMCDLRNLKHQAIAGLIAVATGGVATGAARLALPALEHSGIYGGGGTIIHRTGDGDGFIEAVDPKKFLAR